MAAIYISDEVASVIDLYQYIHPVLNIEEYLAHKAHAICTGHRTRHPGSAVEIGNWFPPYIGHGYDRIYESEFTLANALHTISRIHGYKGWDEVTNTRSTLDEPFEEAINSLLKGDMITLEYLLLQNPTLAKQHSRYAHQATLLHYCTSNGIETERQVVPANLPEVVDLLLKHGADKKAKMNVYDGRFTPIELASTSANPEKAGINKILCDNLS